MPRLSRLPHYDEIDWGTILQDYIKALEDIAMAAQKLLEFYQAEEGNRPWFQELREALDKVDIREMD